MQTRKRKLEQEENQPNKYQKTEQDEDDILDNEKFEYFLSLPLELQNEIYQRCTFPVKIHFNEVCKAFGITGGWVRELVFPVLRTDLKPSILTRFTSLKRLYYINSNEYKSSDKDLLFCLTASFSEELPQYAQYLTALEELGLGFRTPKNMIPLIIGLTNLRKLTIPEFKWEDKTFLELTKLTGLQSMNVTCKSFLVEFMTAFMHLTELRCAFENRPGPVKTLLKLTNLKKLHISGSSNVVDLAQLTQLEALELFDVEFKDIKSLQNFKNLTQLQLKSLMQTKTVNFSFQMPQIKSLSLPYIPNITQEFLANFPNLNSFEIRNTFLLPPNAEQQLTKLSLGSINYTKERMDELSKLTNLKSLKLHGSFSGVLTEENWKLPTTLRELLLIESYRSSVNILPCLTKLGNLERVTLCEVKLLEQQIKQFLKAMPHLRYVSFRGSYCSGMSFHKRKSWFEYLRKNKIYTDIEFE